MVLADSLAELDVTKHVSSYLLIDDPGQALKPLEEFLRKDGHQICYTSSREKALVILEKGEFDAIVFPVDLPRTDPAEFLETIRRDHPNSDIFLVLPVTETEGLAHFYQAGIAAHLPLPFTFPLVRIILSQVAERRRLLQIVEKSRHYQQLARTDGLTGLYNHRFFHQILEYETERAVRYGAPLSLLMIDVDHFKFYNDHHGHVAGDEVLRDISKILVDSVRKTDYVCRYGGEEFAVILPHTTKNKGLVLADRLREKVARNPFLHGDEQPEGSLTVSVGLSGLPDDTMAREVLIQLADQALYQAKESGRNQVCEAEASEK